MKELSERQWTDFKSRYGYMSCPFCKEQRLNFDAPKFDVVAGIEVAAVTCCECGHVELFDIAVVCDVADKQDKEYRDKGWR